VGADRRSVGCNEQEKSENTTVVHHFAFIRAHTHPPGRKEGQAKPSQAEARRVKAGERQGSCWRNQPNPTQPNPTTQNPLTTYLPGFKLTQRDRLPSCLLITRHTHPASQPASQHPTNQPTNDQKRTNSTDQPTNQPTHQPQQHTDSLTHSLTHSLSK